MSRSQIHLHWDGRLPAHYFRTGVSLHGHTLHSRESLDFIYNGAKKAPILAAAFRQVERRYESAHGARLDLNRGWWTPPLGAGEAYRLERAQIESMGIDALVSLTDHDDIEAPVSLHVLEGYGKIPVAFEWTTPYGPVLFHLGIHNLPLSSARSIFNEQQAWRRTADSAALAELLAAIHRLPGTLTVFNHPFWDESHAGAEMQMRVAREFMARYGEWIHAVELNGLRPSAENAKVLDFGTASGKPAISGGDRHGLEPSAVLNLTNARSFEEFAEEVRDGSSDVLIMPQYRQSLATRILRSISDVLSTHDGHANGWRLWSDRAFFQCEDGQVRSFTELFGSRMPHAVSLFVRLARFASQPGVRRLRRDAFPERGLA